MNDCYEKGGGGGGGGGGGVIQAIHRPWPGIVDKTMLRTKWREVGLSRAPEIRDGITREQPTEQLATAAK